ncbi:poly(A) polymerase [Streptomyces sp. NPDC006645]|uniref:poly(A) polymerase n=1 Tax=unclassified Streptomyces TaxID=2593676 RepID=UPI0033BEC072
MRTSDQLYHQVRWDPRFDPARFVLGVSRRGTTPGRIPLPAFVPGGDIPWHRVLFVEADGEVVWDRATGVDRIDATDAGRVRQPRLLRAPFFTARTAYAYGSEGWRPAQGGPSTSPADSLRVRVLTWNTLWDRYDSDRVHTAARRPMLLDALRESDADVIALQEVERELLTMLLNAPWVRASYTIGGDPGGRGVDDDGLLLLSRLPVREAGHHVLGSHKAVTALTVETAAGPLVVAATHLSSDHSKDGPARRRAELASLAEGLGGIDADVILLGDFNDGAGGREGPAAALGLRDAWSEVYGSEDSTPTFDPVANPLAAVASLTGRAGRLDRVLVRGSGVAVTGAALRGDTPDPSGLFISDHYGVEAEVALGAAETPADVLDVPATARTAVAWIPPRELWAPLQAVRREHDPQVDRWPPHVNLLFGFVPESDFERAAPLVAAAAAETAPFTARLAGVHTFGHREDATLWLDPAAGGEGPWAGLREELERRFPRCGGRRAEGFTPHLTLGRSRDPQRVAAGIEARLGEVTATVGELALLSRRGDEPMRVRATVALGTGEVSWLPEDTPSPDSSTLHADEAARSIAGTLARTLPDGVVHTVGSRRMGCAVPGADLDLVAALPGATVDMGELRRRVGAALPASQLREVVGARVPGLRFTTGESGVDLAVVASGSLPPTQAVDRRAELGEAAAVALSAVSDAAAIRDAVGERHDAFAALARDVKSWAAARGLDSAPFGGLPGLAWAVLAARTVAEAGPLGREELLRHFFGTWAAWDWRVPVSLRAGAAPAAVPAAAPVTVLTPTAPVRSCTDQVGPGQRDLLVRELYAAWELAAPPPMHRRHAAWAVVTVDTRHPDTLGRFRGRVRALLTALEAAGVRDAHAWPRPYATEGAGVRYAIGLGEDPPDAAALATIVEPWGRGLRDVAVAWARGGDVPTLA